MMNFSISSKIIMLNVFTYLLTFKKRGITEGHALTCIIYKEETLEQKYKMTINVTKSYTTFNNETCNK